jgi:gliding motility-associated-like protein
VVGGSISVNAPSTVNIVFSEAVTGFTLTDISLTNATASNLQTTDNIIYTVLVTPATEGIVSIKVPANAAVNVGGNNNSLSNTLSYYYDPNPPVITSVAVPANGYYKAGDVLNFTVNFSENVQANNPAPSMAVIIGSTSVQAAYVGGSNTNALSFSYTVQDGDMDMDGITPGTSLQLNGGVIRDLSANNANLALQNIGSTAGVLVNTSHATVTLSTAASRVNAPFTVTVTFSEAVTGLIPGDFTTTNATVGTLQTTDNITYTVVVTPIADGSVSISLPADAAVNVANNGTKASNTLTVTRDATAPVITAAQNFNILQNSTAGTPIGQVTATDASGITQNYTITSDPTGGAFQISATGSISVKDMAILNNNVGSTINVVVTVSDGLNTSAATAVAIKIDAINKAPVLNAINNVVLCATVNSQTIQLTGASAVEPTQTYTLSIASNQALFDALTVNAAGLITYQLKPSVTSGVATITVTIKDNGGTANGGVDTYQRTFTITVNALPIVTITSDKGNSLSKGDIVHLTATGGATYNWTATTSSIISGAQTAVAEARPQANTTYQVTATSSLGCNSTASINIATIEDFKVDATNVLTPNGDGKNDKWVIRNIDSYPDNELKIFDRSGRLVFSQRNYNNTWDGKVNGHPLAEGTYYYFLTISGGVKTAKGFITIITKAN